ncbi:unnamed protein product [Mytilus coruscus]|uniref:DUF19 domain-containing protein n=1 Tax=Mytilus coruscus TaxID=42192 RepID=A0A6J8BEV5_MYTCO|nr:unnamed protein product [Mytilus coruscus]
MDRRSQFTIIIVVFLISYTTTEQDCRKVIDCIESYGAVTSLPFVPDYENFNRNTYTLFLQTLCSNLNYYRSCQINNHSLLVTSCQYIIGEFEADLSVTQEKKNALGKSQCSQINGMVDAVDCLLSNVTLESALSSCTTEMSTNIPTNDSVSLCTIVTVWHDCIFVAVQGTCTSLAGQYWEEVTEEYKNAFCSESKASHVTCYWLTFLLGLFSIQLFFRD